MLVRAPDDAPDDAPDGAAGDAPDEAVVAPVRGPRPALRSRAARARAALRRPLVRRLLAADAVGAVAALACLTVLLTGRGPAASGAELLAAVLLLALGRAVRLPLRLGERRVLVAAYVEGSVLLSLVLVGPAWTPLLVGVVTLAHQVPRRLPAWRAGFNVAALVGPTGVGALVFAVAAGDDPGSARLALALALAAPCVNVLNLLAVTAVVAAAHDEPLAAPLRQDVLTELLGLGLQVGVTVAIVACLQEGQYVAAGLLPGMAVLALQQLLRRLDGVTERDALDRLEQATRLVTTLDLDATVHELLRRAQVLFGAEQAAFVLGGPSGDRSWTSDGAPLQAAPGRVLSRAVDVRGGSLALQLRFPRAPQLAPAEERVLQTFLATASTTVGHSLEYAVQADAARSDELTGLGNRQRLLDEVAANAGPLALILLELDRLGQVNETLGYATGDEVLREAARRIATTTRGQDVAVRLGTDEFAVVLRGLPPGQESLVAVRRARQLLDALAAPFLLDGLELPLEASAGVALRDDAAEDTASLLRRAGLGLHQAARARCGVALQDERVPAGDGLRLLGQLAHGLRTGAIEVHYQPVVDLRDGRVVAHEALARWRHPELGLLPPSRFVPEAEQSALIVPLTVEVLRQAARATRSWSQLRPELSVAVNVSPRCLLGPDFSARVLALLAHEGLPASQLTVEITETLALADLDVVDRNLTRLRDAGVRLSLDDFGTGYSSMRALRRLPVREVKVDRQFVAAAPGSAPDRAVVQATVALARGLGLTVVAEGIETEEQLALVTELGCDLAQGYLLGRPLPAAETAGRLLPHPR